MNAIRKLPQSPKPGTTLQDDGSMLVSVEALERFGGGSAKRGRADLRLLLAAERESPVWSGPTKRPESVRIATIADEQAILALLLEDLSHNAAHIAAISEERVLEHIQVGTRTGKGVVGVIGPVGAPVACLIIIPIQWWFSNSWHLLEVVNYVHPDHRNSAHASDLLDFAKWVSDTQTKNFGYLTPLVCGVMGAWRTRSKIAVYARKFWQVGACFLYPAPPMRGN